MTKFKVVLERTDTITKHAEMLVEASSPEDARQTILADLEIDPGSYDDDLKLVSEDIGNVEVKAVTTKDHGSSGKKAA